MSPIRVDLYVLTDSNHDVFWALVCRLVEKAYATYSHVWIRCESQEQVMQMDNLLWTYQDTAFIPHATESASWFNQVPIGIGVESAACITSTQLIINLAKTAVTTTNPELQRLIEVILPEEKTLARTRYRLYQQNAYALHVHTIPMNHVLFKRRMV